MHSQLSFNLLSTAILILDSKANIVDLNESAEQLLGYSERQIKTKIYLT